MTLGEKVRELRIARKLGLRELARLAGTAAPHLSDIEWGRRNPSDGLMEKLAEALGVDVDVLQKYDTRAPIEELRRRGSKDPQFAVALRRVLDSDLTGEELLKLIRKHSAKE